MTRSRITWLKTSLAEQHICDGFMGKVSAGEEEIDAR